MIRDEKSRQNCVFLFFVFVCFHVYRFNSYTTLFKVFKKQFLLQKDGGRDEDGGEDEVGSSTSKGRSASEDDDDVEELSPERGEFAKKRVSP